MYVYITASFNLIWIRIWIWISICISRSASLDLHPSIFICCCCSLSDPLQLLADSFAPPYSPPSFYSFLCKCYICCFFSRFYVYNIYIIYSFFYLSFFFSFRFLFLTLFLMLLFSASSSCYISSLLLLLFLLPLLSTVLLPLFLRRWWRAAPVPIPQWKSVWVWKCATSSASSSFFSTSSSSYRTDSATPVWVWFDSASLDSSTGQISWSQLQCRHIASSLLSSLRVCLCVCVEVCFLFFSLFFLYPHWFSFSCLILIRLEPAPVPPSCICSLRVCVFVCLSLSHGPSGSLFVHLFLSFLLFLSSPWADPRAEA